MPLSRRAADRIASRVFLGIIVAALATCPIVLYPLVRGVWITERDIEILRPAAAVRDARALIAGRNANPARYESITEAPALPPSLRIRELRYAKVHADHVDLVVWRNPDAAVGMRIWSERHRPHRDKPTRYRDVFFFRFDNDAPASPSNIP